MQEESAAVQSNGTYTTMHNRTYR